MYALTRTPSDSDRLACVIAHGGTVFAWFLAPLLVYVLKRNDSEYVRAQALGALLWSLLGSAAALFTFGLAIPVFLVFHVIAAVKAINGQPYEYPLVGEVARNMSRT